MDIHTERTELGWSGWLCKDDFDKGEKPICIRCSSSIAAETVVKDFVAIQEMLSAPLPTFARVVEEPMCNGGMIA